MHFETDHDRCAHPAVGDAQQSSVLADLIFDLEGDARTKARAIDGKSGVHADTHWSRILSVDLDGDDDGWPGGSSLPPDEANSHGDAGDRFKQRLVTAVILFALCALAYLAVNGGLHALAVPDATSSPATNAIGLLAPATATSPNRFATENDHARIEPIP